MPPAEPDHLSNHQRNTLRELFQHPVSHNIEWHAVISLLETVGTVTERHDGKLAVSIGAQREVLEPGRGKDLDGDDVALVRRMLSLAGYSEASGHTEASQQG